MVGIQVNIVVEDFLGHDLRIRARLHPFEDFGLDKSRTDLTNSDFILHSESLNLFKEI
jgi:hypothetical protein